MSKTEAFMETTTTSKGQIVIPSSVRRKLGIKNGTKIQIEMDTEKRIIILKPITREYIHSLSGKLKDKNLLGSLEYENIQRKEA
jgi:AbrB family looped-hinge helix DNA binding protein